MGWIATAVLYGMHWANDAKRLGKTRKLRTIQALILGWLVFLVPTAIANIVNPASRSGIPSVMCGFAVLFALVLTLYILPRIAVKKDTTKLEKPAAA